MAVDFVVNRSMYAEARKQGLTLSALLENKDPSAEYGVEEIRQGRDAFTRALERLDIRTRSVPGYGIAAHTVERFFDDSDGHGAERSALFPEWISRVYRFATRVIPTNSFAGGIGMQGRVNVTNSPLSDVVFPDAMDPAMRFQALEPSLLSFLVGRTRTETSDTFKAFYLDDSTVEADARLRRVSEYGEIPAMRITGSDNTIQAYKYGRRLQGSYEVLRRMSLDFCGWAIAYIGAKADSDKFLTALDVIINGDGNSGTAITTTAGSTLDAAAAGALTLKMWLKFGMLYRAPYRANVVLGTDDSIANLLLLNAGSANLPPQVGVSASGALGAVSLARPIYGGMVAINDSNVTANALVAIDNRFTVEMVSEAGADIVEVDRVINSQYEELVISETIGFDIMTLGQNRSLTYTV